MPRRQISLREILNMPMIREAGLTRDTRAHELGFHRNHGHEITFSLSGEYIWELKDGRQLIVPGGHVCVTQPDVEHRGLNDLITPGHLLFFVLDFAGEDAAVNSPFQSAELAELHTRFSTLGNSVVLGNRELCSQVDALALALNEYEDNVPLDCLQHFWVRSLVGMIILATLRSFSNPTDRDGNPLIQAAVEYMNENITENLTIEQLAQKVGLGRTRFCELFQQTLGQSPGDYQQRLRCKQACEALRNSNRTVTEIAFDFGYSSSQYFSLCVRKFTGLSPSEYRRQFS